VSWPEALVVAGADFGTLLRVHVDYQITVKGHAFYYPSQNAG